MTDQPHTMYWVCDHCGQAVAGGIFYPAFTTKGEERWCEDCHFDALDNFLSHREYTALLVREQQLTSQRGVA